MDDHELLIRHTVRWAGERSQGAGRWAAGNISRPVRQPWRARGEQMTGAQRPASDAGAVAGARSTGRAGCREVGKPARDPLALPAHHRTHGWRCGPAQNRSL